MRFDDRTFLFSASITMAILAIVILSMRRGTGKTMEGLGAFATANLLGIVGGFLLALRDAIPFAISFLAAIS